MVDFLQMVLSGIAVGSSYALMGLGMVLIYKASEVPNFVQGEMALLPIFIAFMLLSSYGLPYYIAFPATLVFALFLPLVSGTLYSQEREKKERLQKEKALSRNYSAR